MARKGQATIPQYRNRAFPNSCVNRFRNRFGQISTNTLSKIDPMTDRSLPKKNMVPFMRLLREYSNGNGFKLSHLKW